MWREHVGIAAIALAACWAAPLGLEYGERALLISFWQVLERGGGLVWSGGGGLRRGDLWRGDGDGDGMASSRDIDNPKDTACTSNGTSCAIFVFLKRQGQVQEKRGNRLCAPQAPPNRRFRVPVLANRVIDEFILTFWSWGFPCFTMRGLHEFWWGFPYNPLRMLILHIATPTRRYVLLAYFKY